MQRLWVKRVWHAPQTMHSVPPKNGWYVPGTHSSQPSQLVPPGRYVPFAHGMHSPLAPQYPGGHSTTTTVETVALYRATTVEKRFVYEKELMDFLSRQLRLPVPASFGDDLD